MRRADTKKLLLGAAAAGLTSAASTAYRSRRINSASRVRRTGEQGRALRVRGADGTRIHARAHGPQDAPVVVFAHGWTNTQEVWRTQIESLSSELRCVVYDQRGHGLSEKAGQHGYEIEVLASDLDAVIAAACDDSAKPLLVGHSMGGMTIAAWAGDHLGEVAARARGALLLSTGMGDLVDESLVIKPLPGPFATIQGRGAQEFLESPVSLRSLPVGLTRAAVGHIAFGPNPPADGVELTLRMLYDCRGRARAGCGRAMRELDLYEALLGLEQIPVRVLGGAKDKMTPPIQSERIAEALNGAQLEIIPEVGHMTQLECPQRVNKAIREMALAVAPAASPEPAAS